ncbi:MAG TPA: hypothetical protein VG370_16020 [Chloroflexota bacterium]|jgi:predicted RNase H-like HicB family nuclease|nr:hypothetical protein [Chloroflexota bacterium]
MVAKVSFTAVFEPVENGWTQARIAELPGVVTAAPTLDEAKEMLLDALREYLLALGEPDGARDETRGTRGSIDITIDAA